MRNTIWINGNVVQRDLPLNYIFIVYSGQYSYAGKKLDVLRFNLDNFRLVIFSR